MCWHSIKKGKYPALYQSWLSPADHGFPADPDIRSDHYIGYERLWDWRISGKMDNGRRYHHRWTAVFPDGASAVPQTGSDDRFGQLWPKKWLKTVKTALTGRSKKSFTIISMNQTPQCRRISWNGLNSGSDFWKRNLWEKLGIRNWSKLWRNRRLCESSKNWIPGKNHWRKYLKSRKRDGL